MVFKSDIICLNQRNEEAEDNTNEDDSEIDILRWEYMYNLVYKTLSFEIKEIDIFNLDFYDQFSILYYENQLVVYSFLSKYLFIS